jgi:hypothetical protein
VGQPEGKRPLGKPRRRWEGKIKMDLEEVGWGHELDRFGPVEGQVPSTCEHCNESSGSIKCREFLG